jgi:SAM-dependent methyltransferase
MATSSGLDFGYPWWLNYGHLAVAVPALGFLVLGFMRGWPKLRMLLLGAVAVWASMVFLLIQFGLGINTVPPLPTQKFLPSGTGRVLDLGAGTGRSSIMVLAARRQATVVASDLFGESFDQHFGRGASPQERLLRNLKVAGVDGRAEIVTADMRKLPFEAASFDAIVSAYAVDHLNRAGIKQALGEAARAIKPGGDFLLILVANDGWAKLAYGPLLAHGGTRGKGWWIPQLEEAGFQVVEDGATPGTLYLLARKDASVGR